MFEITYSDNETFEAHQNAGKAHKGGTYDFTFENRYIIYHANLRHKVDYIAIDMSTGLASFVITKNPGNLYTEASYKRLSDTGVVSILDPRAISKSYSVKIRQALHKFPKVDTTQDIECFMRGVKDEEYYGEMKENRK